MLKKAECWRIDVVLEKTLESPLDCNVIKSVNPKGNQSWTFTRTDAEAEASVLWPPDEKSRLIRQDPDSGKDWRQEEKGMSEDEMVGWHHWFNGHEFEQAPGDGEGQRSLVCCSLSGGKESDVTEQLNNNHKTDFLWFSFFLFFLKFYVKLKAINCTKNTKFDKVWCMHIPRKPSVQLK